MSQQDKQDNPKKQDLKSQDLSILQHEADHAKAHKKVSVLGYLAILFAAAFFLLMMSYLQQQRNNEEVISGLKNSASAVQSIENLIVEKESLTQQVSALEREKAQLEKDLQIAKDAGEDHLRTSTNQQKQLEAMDYLRKIQELYAIQYYRQARALITSFQAAGLEGALPTTSQVADEPSPAETYREIYTALYPD